ncbi:GDP-L-galactose phosphorylase 1-like [Coffea eugenioides]|uniref:GDP-D-glucose phosphorylase 1 n=1 Tax=Coffea arabica TaxID=13443 RepID=A0A6P6TH58_COFAR|nr:GDP-L-galactose phosphorylase 1-like [Coffea arabica]XP_027162035.1 GDP-L-galactose phosphorylase 1-like [Coffea eugenioides]
MLTIKKVPTVVSNYQEDGDDNNNAAGIRTEDATQSQARGCARNCLGKCCLPVSKLPLYAFKKNDYPSKNNAVFPSDDGVSPISFLNNLLLAQWEDRMRRGLFRYDVTSCETKVIPGRYGFIAQLNEGRHLKKRPTEFRIDQVLQPFDENKFNFTKVGQEEVLFRFESNDDDKSRFFSSYAVDICSISPSVVAINVSPIEYGHVLLIPRVLDCLPQRIDHESFLLALYFAKEAADPFLRVGYNSLGAFATINHLHFQAYYLSVTFPIEKAPTRRIMARKGLQGADLVVSELLDYPVRGLVFEGGCVLRDLSDAVASSCIYLQQNNVPFNVLIADCGRKIFLLPQCYAEKQALGEVSLEVLETQVNPAVWEISGHMVLKRRKDYDDASEDYAWKLLSEVSLSGVRFESVKACVSEAAGLQVEVDTYNIDQKECIYDSEAPQVASHMQRDCPAIH